MNLCDGAERMQQKQVGKMIVGKSLEQNVVYSEPS